MRGLDRFREFFGPWQGHYVLIGGAAIDILMEEAALPFRVTKDMDIVLVAEAFDSDFARAIWEFVEVGRYTSRQKSTGKHHFYRFHSPTEPGFPFMLELFSRLPDGISIGEHAHLTPLPVGEGVSSLSAILLDDEYYVYVTQGLHELDRLVLLDAEHLIPLKAKAWLDLTARRDAGESVDSRDIRKHRNDVLRLFRLLPRTARFELPEAIREEMGRFLAGGLSGAPEPSTLGLKGVTLTEVEIRLREAYGL